MFYQVVAASVIGGVVSLTGGLLLLWREKFAKRISLYLVSFAAGSLLGAAFFEILPEALGGIGEVAFFFVVAGIISVFVFEKFLGWYHHHDVHHNKDTFEPSSYSVQTILFGDTLHNFIDGIAIALAFAVGFEVGLATTVAVFLHEIPQELGDFGVLIHRGYKRKKIILYNLLTAFATLVGATLAFLFLPFLPGDFIFYALAVAAGTFIYISTSDLIPELREHSKGGLDIGHTAAIIFGIISVAFLSTVIPA